MDMILTYFAAHPTVGFAFLILYGISEIIGGNTKIGENTVYQSVATFLRNTFKAFTTPKV